MINEKEVREFFREEMRERMEDAGLRPYHMGYLCQCTPSAINAYLQGTSLPNPWSLVLMAEHLECSVNELFGIDVDDVELDYERYSASKMFHNEQEYAHCISDRITHLITRDGMTISEFSIQTGIKKDNLKRWTDPHPKLPRAGDIIRLCNALNCTPSDLLGY